jgi:hypothetical protein
VDEDEEEPTENDLLLEEGGDPNDIFENDDGPERDFSWETPPEGLTEWLLARPPQAQWRVIARAYGTFHVEHLGKAGWIHGPAESPVVRRRLAVLTQAVLRQRQYILTGDIDTLVVLSADELWSPSPDGGTPELVDEYQNGLADVAGDIRGQYFYDCMGHLHAIRFLLQDDVCGFALARVYHALAMITDEERRSRTSMLSDSQVAEELNRRLGGNVFDAPRVARWRAKKREARERDWSVKRLHLPKRQEREESNGIV